MSLLEEFVKIYPVDDVARSINCLRPEGRRRLVIIKHSVSHLNKSRVLVLHDAILLRSIRSRQFVSNTKHIEIFIEVSVLELGSIITPDMLDLHTKVSGSP